MNGSTFKALGVKIPTKAYKVFWKYDNHVCTPQVPYTIWMYQIETPERFHGSSFVCECLYFRNVTIDRWEEYNGEEA